ncbi:MAG TPA: hypothetical protein VH796_18085 [Nitrososphaeraceae archaeon]
MQRSTTQQRPLTGTRPTAGACVECFNMLNAAQQSAFLNRISVATGINSTEQLCGTCSNYLILGDPRVFDLEENIGSALDFLDNTHVITPSTHSN